MRLRRMLGSSVSLVVVVTLLATSCGDDGSSAERDQSSPTTTTAVTTTRAPQTGGVLRYASNTEIRGLDPTVAFGEAVAGNIELAAIYDVLVRWDPSTGKYEMGTAESLTPSADFVEWTLKIRPGIKFTDNTVYDGAAVKAGLERHMSAANTTKTRTNMSIVSTITLVDALTLKITLKTPWPGFPADLADRVGSIPSPTAIATCGTATPVQCAFNLKPVGAGPFMVKDFRPSEVLELVRNPTYYGKAPYLDGVRVIPGGDGGGPKTLDSLTAGTFDVAHLADPVTVQKATAAKLVSFVDNRQAGSFGVLYFNNGLSVTCKGGLPAGPCAGRPDGVVTPPVPTQNLKVRQAIAAAIDPAVVNDRAWGGVGKPGTELLQKDFRYFPGVAGPKYDATQAKTLFAQAKAEGFDGKIRVLCSRDQQPFTLAIVTMLQAAGFTVASDTEGDVNAMAAKFITNKDFDIVCGGLRIGEDDLQWTQGLYSAFGSDSSSNRLGYKNPKMDAAILKLRDAKTDAERVGAYKEISEIYVQDLPVLVLASRPEVIAAQAKVHGLKATLLGAVLLNEAWIEQ